MDFNKDTNEDQEFNIPTVSPSSSQSKPQAKGITALTAVILCVVVAAISIISTWVSANNTYQYKLDLLSIENGHLSTAYENLKALYDKTQDENAADYTAAVVKAYRVLEEARAIVKDNYVFYKDEELGVKEESIKEALKEATYNIYVTKKVTYDSEDGEEPETIELTAENVQAYLLDSYFNEIPDLFTMYHTREEMKDMMTASKGKLYGIGVYVYFDIDTGYIYVNQVMPSSPAEKAGIMRGDRISAVEGVNATEETYNECVGLVAGELGTEVNIEIVRNGVTMNFKPIRSEVRTKAVFTEYKEDYAWISVVEFTGNVAEDLKAEVKSALAKKVKGFVFDMRDNPGGDLNVICDVLDYLLPEGPIVNIMDADNNKVYSKTSDSKCVDAPMVVLCNENTASAAELFTSALKDYKKAVIIGTKTYGKGTMQSIISLSDGSGVRVSVNYYNPPFSENYHHKGITPDIVIEENEKVSLRRYLRGTEDDVQLAKAIEELKKINNK